VLADSSEEYRRKVFLNCGVSLLVRLSNVR
jgi:hypothetical protein